MRAPGCAYGCYDSLHLHGLIDGMYEHNDEYRDQTGSPNGSYSTVIDPTPPAVPSKMHRRLEAELHQNVEQPQEGNKPLQSCNWGSCSRIVADITDAPSSNIRRPLSMLSTWAIIAVISAHFDAISDSRTLSRRYVSQMSPQALHPVCPRQNDQTAPEHSAQAEK